MFTLITNILALVLVLGVMIFVHELGHFVTAKYFGVRVDVFSFGFGPRLFGVKRGDTDYRVCALPLGGYVSMKGENPDEELTGAPDEYLSRPKWQRFLILVMGPTMNVLLALALLASIFMIGIEVNPLLQGPVDVGWVEAESPAGRAGLRPGDRIVAIDGEPLEDWQGFRMAVAVSAGQPLTMQVRRDGRTVDLEVTPEAITRSEVGHIGAVMPPIPPVVGSVPEDSPASRAGLQPGDRVVAVAGQPVEHFYAMTRLVRARPEEPVEFEIVRDGRRRTLTIVTEALPESGGGTLGGVTPPDDTELRRFGPVAATGRAVQEIGRQVTLLGEVLGRIFTGRMSVKTLSGPIEIARFSGGAARAGFRDLLYFMAVVSLQLGLLNLLPIPVLDGGHIAIILFEGAIRRDLSLKVKERMLQVGFILLVTLMVMVVALDISKNVPLGWLDYVPFF